MLCQNRDPQPCPSFHPAVYSWPCPSLLTPCMWRMGLPCSSGLRWCSLQALALMRMSSNHDARCG